MRINERTKIIGEKVILIPYEEKHVEKYHTWMQSPELQELTASEPLSLEEEYKMQKAWRNDEDKCTFLILSKSCYEATSNEIDSLVGDVNLFLEVTDNECKVGEAEIMVAEESYRRQGLGREAMLLMLNYGQEHLGISKFVAKIGLDNFKSINLFREIHFVETSQSDVFREITMERIVAPDWVNWIRTQLKFEVDIYDR